MTEPTPAAATTPATRPPASGDASIDAVLAELDDLPGRPLAEHHDRLVQAHEALHAALERRDDGPTGVRPA